jgi:hypothetical protein
MKVIITHFVLALVFINILFAENKLDENTQLMTIPPLAEVIEAAYLFSPLLKSKSKAIEVFEEEIKIERKEWMKHIYIEGATNYGLYDHLIVSGQSTYNETSTGLLTRDEQIRYYGGIRIKLPLAAVTTRRNHVKVKDLSREQAKYELLQLKLEIKQIIIEAYFQLKYWEECLRTCNKINQTLEVSYLKAEKDVLNGHMDLNEFALLASTAGKAKNDYLKAKNNFYAQYHTLQSLTGITFNSKK